MTYTELTHRLARFLFGSARKGHECPELIDRHEHGELTRLKDGTYEPRPANQSWQLACKQYGHPEQITRRHIEAHLAGQSTYYYRSSRRSGYVFACIDIDAHEGQTDAQLVAEAIQQVYLPGAYYEPSTHGRGIHFYALVKIGQYVSRRKVNQWLRSVAIALREIVAGLQYNARVDSICGDFSEYDVDPDTRERVPVRMGRMAKLPRLPNGQADMERLENAPTFQPAVLQLIIDDYKELRAKQKGRAVRTTKPINPPKETPRETDTEWKGMNRSDPRSRAVHAVMHLARDLGRLPENSEAREFYERSGLATVTNGGDTQKDIRRREKRIKAAIDYVGQTFEPMGNGYHAETLLQIIRQHVKGEHLATDGLCYSKQITHEDLAIALYTIERASFDQPSNERQKWTCPTVRIEAMFRKLREEKKTARGINRNKATACKKILERAKLADVIDHSYEIGTRGRALGNGWDEVEREGRGKRIVVGQNHPRRREWERLAPARTLAGARDEASLISPVLKTGFEGEGTTGRPVAHHQPLPSIKTNNTCVSQQGNRASDFQPNPHHKKHLRETATGFLATVPKPQPF